MADADGKRIVLKKRTPDEAAALAEFLRSMSRDVTVTIDAVCVPVSGVMRLNADGTIAVDLDAD